MLEDTNKYVGFKDMEWLQGLAGVSLNKSKGQDGKKPIGEVDNVRISCDGEVIDSAEAQIL
jgi:hypothetical protein